MGNSPSPGRLSVGKTLEEIENRYGFTDVAHQTHQTVAKPLKYMCCSPVHLSAL